MNGGPSKPAGTKEQLRGPEESETAQEIEITLSMDEFTIVLPFSDYTSEEIGRYHEGGWTWSEEKMSWLKETDKGTYRLEKKKTVTIEPKMPKREK